MPAWEFQRKQEIVKLEPSGPLIVRVSGGVDLAVDAAVSGCGVIHLFEDWLKPQLASGALEPVLLPWWQTFAGPFLYYPGRSFSRRACTKSTNARSGAGRWRRPG